VGDYPPDVNGDSWGAVRDGGGWHVARSRALGVSGALVAGMLVTGGWSAAYGGFDPRDVVNGGSAAERMVGTSRADQMYGHRGDDRISGRRAGDYLAGGRGDDRLWPGQGADLIRCGPGDDLVVGVGKVDQVDPNCETVRLRPRRG
jgi:hypothetical protein